MACRWLAEAGHRYDVAAVQPFRGGVTLDAVDPARYSHVVFVCGPFGKGQLEERFLGRFGGCRLVGLDLSMLEPLAAWNPFDVLLERDSDAAARPDIAFASTGAPVPVVGVCLVESYPGARDAVAHAAIERLVAAREMATVRIDTRLDRNGTGLRSAAEIESLLARMDTVVTTRLHGMVLALKNGVPVVAIDPEAGGGKICRQAEAIGWPTVFAADAAVDEQLREALDWCLTPPARARAAECRARALESLRRVREEFVRALATGNGAGPRVAPADATAIGPSRLGAPADSMRRLARALLPAAFRRRLRSLLRAGETPFASRRRLTPLSRDWGLDRGLPVDRHYIEGFLARHAADVRGRVLEVGDDKYTRRFGGARVTGSDVLHVSPDDPRATMVADLQAADHLPSAHFDCVILTQTLHLIYDYRTAIRTLHRMLKPGGVLLATFPGITQITDREWAGHWFWSFTSHSARRMFAEVFSPGSVLVESAGNVLSASAFLYGLAAHELTPAELDHRDADYEVTVAVRAEKAA